MYRLSMQAIEMDRFEFVEEPSPVQLRAERGHRDVKITGKRLEGPEGMKDGKGYPG